MDCWYETVDTLKWKGTAIKGAIKSWTRLIADDLQGCLNGRQQCPLQELPAQ